MGEHEHARELMLDYINEALQRISEAKDIVDTSYEASVILDEIEKRCVGRLRGELVFSDPDEDDAA